MPDLVIIGKNFILLEFTRLKVQKKRKRTANKDKLREHRVKLLFISRGSNASDWLAFHPGIGENKLGVN